MDLFKLVGSIFIKNDKANEDIDKTKKKAEDMASKVGHAFQNAGQNITKVGKALAPVSAGMATALGFSVKSASDFTDGMAKMSTLFDTQKVSVEDLSKKFLDLSNKTGLASTELAEAGYQALSAGVEVDKAVGFVETAGNLAKAGFTSTTTAVDVLTTAMNAYGKEAGSADDIANKLVRTQNLGKTTVDELASSMGKIIPTASGMNVNIDNLTSGYVSLTKQGIATAEATTYMNSMMNELGDSGTKLGGIIKEKTEKSFQDLMGEGKSLADVLQITKDYADKNGIAYNELWGSAEAGKSAMAILNGGVEEFNNTVGTMSDKTNDVGQALEKLETPSVKVKESWNKIKNAGIELGTTIMSALAPTLEKVTGWVEKATTWFSKLDEGTKQNIATAMALVAGLAPVLIIVGKIVTIVGKMILFGKKMTSVFKTIGVGAKALWGILSANPFGLVVAGIVGIIAIIAVLWNKSETFRNFCINLWNTIKTKLTSILNSIKTTFSNTWNSIKSAVTNAINNVKTSISNGIQSAKDAVSNKLEAIKSKFQSVFDKAKSIVKTAISKIKGMFNFSWSLPKLKLPHFKVSGGKAPWGFMGKGSFPSVSVKWYKKAMEQPYMFTEPTVFSMNPVTGKAKGAGEAGDEIMYGKSNLMQDIREGVRAEVGDLSYKFDKLLDLLEHYLTLILSKVDKEIYLDSGTLVGELIDKIDDELGDKRLLTERGM